MVSVGIKRSQKGLQNQRSDVCDCGRVNQCVIFEINFKAVQYPYTRNLLNARTLSYVKNNLKKRHYTFRKGSRRFYCSQLTGGKVFVLIDGDYLR